MNRGAILRVARRHWPAGAAAALAAVLLFWGLGARPFWSDEAITAGYARSLLTHALPYAWDGRNLLCFGDGSALTADLYATTYPMLQFYVVWPFFRVLGTGEAAGRLPFALFALATVALTYVAGLLLLRSRAAAGCAAFLLAGSVSFLLFARQCRYYALTMFFSTLLLIAVWRLPRKGRLRLPVFLLAGLLLFHSHFLIFYCFMGGLSLAWAAVWGRRGGPRRLTAGGAILLVLTVPWVLWVLHAKGSSPGETAFRFQDRVRLFGWYLRDINRADLFPVFVLPLLGWALYRRSEREAPPHRNAALLLGVAFLQVGFTSLVSIQRVDITNEADLRYVANLLPVFALLLGFVCARVGSVHRAAGAALLLALLFSNVLTAQPLRCYLYDYVRELADPPVTSTQRVIETLSRLSKPGEMVLVEPAAPYDMRTPLVYYLGDRLLFCGILAPDEARILRRNPTLPGYLYSSEVEPDWIVKFGERSLRRDIHERLREKGLVYRRGVIPIYWRDLSRPELLWHAFHPVRRFSAHEQVFLLQRIRRTPSPR